jgi:hypothetical protein
MLCFKTFVSFSICGKGFFFFLLLNLKRRNSRSYSWLIHQKVFHSTFLSFSRKAKQRSKLCLRLSFNDTCKKIYGAEKLLETKRNDQENLFFENFFTVLFSVRFSMITFTVKKITTMFLDITSCPSVFKMEKKLFHSMSEVKSFERRRNDKKIPGLYSCGTTSERSLKVVWSKRD